MKDIKFAQIFPSYHPRKKQPTNFIEKVMESFNLRGDIEVTDEQLDLLDFSLTKPEIFPKWHTVRAGNRFSAGDWFIPKIWTHRPYHSSPIAFGPPIQVEYVCDLVIVNNTITYGTRMNKIIHVGYKEIYGMDRLTELAKNDGLSPRDLLDWFKVKHNSKAIEFEGQVISWSKDIRY